MKPRVSREKWGEMQLLSSMDGGGQEKKGFTLCNRPEQRVGSIYDHMVYYGSGTKNYLRTIIDISSGTI